MISGFYTAASGILTQQRIINTTGNNLVNSQTNGYRADRVITSTFEQNLLTRIENGQYTRIGEGDPALIVEEVETLFDTSSLEETYSPFDMALAGQGYFNIAGNEATYLTRNGNFNIDEEGYLILGDVGRVLGTDGEIYVGGSEFHVSLEGGIYDLAGNLLGELLTTQPTEEAAVNKLENGFLVATETDVVQNPTVYQYTIERSNVDMNDEYTRLIEAQRSLQSNATALRIVDEMNARAAGLASIT